MPTTYTIPAGNLYMNAVTWSGNSSTQTLPLNFAPDLIWNKSRSAASGHSWWDVIRGTGAQISSNETTAETTGYNAITSFSNNAISLGADNTGTYNGRTNETGRTYVGWVWKAGGTAVSNTSGSITSSVSANTTSGFSIVTYTGNLTTAGTATVGHGLGVAPAMIIFKGRNAVTSWPVFHTSLTSWNYSLALDLTNAQMNQTSNGSMSAPTSTVFSTNWTTGMNTNGTTEVAYCFAPVAGYSAFGSYSGTGSADGPFVYLGFKPRWLMIKVTNTTNAWVMYDTSRGPYNTESLVLLANDAGAEGSTSNTLDILSNGFKLRGAAQGATNASGNTYIYAAFAENPFKYANAF